MTVTILCGLAVTYGVQHSSAPSSVHIVATNARPMPNGLWQEVVGAQQRPSLVPGQNELVWTFGDSVDVEEHEKAVIAGEPLTVQLCKEAGLKTEAFPTIAGATWEFTHNWDCFGTDITHIAVPPWSRSNKDAIAHRALCASECLKLPNCVSFNYPGDAPGNSFCYIKHSAVHSVLLNLTCHEGRNPDNWDYYTLLKQDCHNDAGFIPTKKEAYDCEAGLQFWHTGWSDKKKKWCCDNENYGCEGDPYDCDVGFANRVVGWSVHKMVWCCRYKQKGCVAGTSGPYNCDVGYANWYWGWSRQKQKWCCKNKQKACPFKEAATFDCDAGYSNWKDGWSPIKSRWCCQNEKRGCIYAADSGVQV